ncbi:hypothetical protein EJ063_12430 [Vibrio aquaticus]|uniref:Uncharacterized protein n=1 Tax=Vibrio aquaticus TaxID=2496559 RepID=A0A432CXM4_9VIBR|nr:hypothetical protein EJ063_12430 [Vibrio aquaticus]
MTISSLILEAVILLQGGRFSSGYSSHQTGLDIDTWLKLADTPFSKYGFVR